jgi:hypothetical protein
MPAAPGKSRGEWGWIDRGGNWNDGGILVRRSRRRRRSGGIMVESASPVEVNAQRSFVHSEYLNKKLSFNYHSTTIPPLFHRSPYHRHLNPHPLQLTHHMIRDLMISDHLFDLLHAADAAKTSFAKFGGIGKDNGFL